MKKKCQKSKYTFSKLFYNDLLEGKVNKKNDLGLGYVLTAQQIFFLDNMRKQDRIFPLNISNLIFVFNKNEKPPEHSMVLSEATHIDIKEKAQT